MAIASMGTLTSCVDRSTTVTPPQDNDTYPTTLDIKNVNFTRTPENAYRITRTFTNALPDAYTVLIYRQAGTTENAPVWQPIPRTFYFENGNEFDYDYDFSKYDVFIYAHGNYDLSTTPQMLNNQTFRVLVVPSALGGKGQVDHNDYDSVIKYYNIDDSKVINL